MWAKLANLIVRNIMEQRNGKPAYQVHLHAVEASHVMVNVQASECNANANTVATAWYREMNHLKCRWSVANP